MTTDDTDLPTSPGSARWAHRVDDLAAAEVPVRRANLRRLADATRRIVHGMAITDMDEDGLGEIAEIIEAVASRFDDTAQRSIYEGFSESANSGDPHGFFDHSPMLGRANPLAPPIALTLVDDHTMVGTATFGAGYEGPPGCVHGGYVAAAFDEVLGATQSLSGHPGMTARLSVDYRSPTPLHTELTFTGRFDRIDGRKIFTSGTVHAGDRLCAEADGLFISIDFTRFAELRARREAQIANRQSDG